MKMRLSYLAAAGVAALAAVLGVGGASAAVVGDEMRLDLTLSIGSTRIADYGDEFRTTGPSSGWRYLYNSGGALGNPANYTALTMSGGQYVASSGSRAIGQSTPDPVTYPQTPPFPAMPATFVRPGWGPWKTRPASSAPRSSLTRFNPKTSPPPA